MEKGVASQWNQALLSACNDDLFDEETLRDVDKIRSTARDMLWEADTDGDGYISFKEMMLTVTLVHESETDAVLKGEDTELLQEKLTYLDPWMKTAKGPTSSTIMSNDKERKKKKKKRELNDKVFVPPPSTGSAPETPSMAHTLQRKDGDGNSSNDVILDPPSQPTSPTKKSLKSGGSADGVSEKRDDDDDDDDVKKVL